MDKDKIKEEKEKFLNDDCISPSAYIDGSILPNEANQE